MSTGILVVEDSGCIEIVNDAALHAFGVTRLEHLKDLDSVQANTSGILNNLKYDSGNIIQYRKDGQHEIPLLIRVSLLHLEEKDLRLYAIQNIKTQLEANEIEAWQKMTRVLSHEISNSVTPISTLGAGIRRKLARGQRDSEGRLVLNRSVANDLIQSAELIKQRGDRLVEFMEHYKSFSRLPEPVPEKLELKSFFENLHLLFSDEFRRLGIEFEFETATPSLRILADPKLFEQAFINLIKNAMDALAEQEDGIVKLKAYREMHRNVVLEVSDNGPGIPEEIQSQVFIPFFTTKPGGSGIGMSLVRKIILTSGGNIQLHSTPRSGTKIVITLPEY
jgi:nitrogen fixation/metabolism regulation signal transduction histidine kinase